MSLLRRTISCILAVIILITLATRMDSIYAEDIYPLEAGEKLLEETVYDEDRADIYTQLEDSIYKKKLTKSNGKWIVEEKTEVQPRWTGLKTGPVLKGGDRRLAAALEDKLESYGTDASSLQQVIDYSDSSFLPPVGEQFENSCVGWAAGYYLRTYQQAQDFGWIVKQNGAAADNHIFSPSFIYNQIRQAGGSNPDGGAEIDDAGALLKNKGAATLNSFPYVPGDIYTLPDEFVLQNAYPHRIRNWELLCSERDTVQYIIQRTKQYLATGDLVVAGSRVGWRFFENQVVDSSGNHIIPRENNPQYKHAYVIVGYDDTMVSPDGIGAFKLVNSWGTNWGDAGFSYISYQAYAENIVEAFVFTDLINEDEQQLKTDIIDKVFFNMDFSGTGRYDIKIKDEADRLVYESSNLQGTEGINNIVWNGKNSLNAAMPDGLYKLVIIPYSGYKPKPAVETPFIKCGKAKGLGATAQIREDVIDHVDIPMEFKADGVLSIKVVYGDTIYNFVANQAVKAGEKQVYKILKSDFDFNGKDLNAVKILIEIM